MFVIFFIFIQLYIKYRQNGGIGCSNTACDLGDNDMSEEDVFKALSDAVCACNPAASKAAAELALKQGINPVDAINKGLVVGMGVIGDSYAEKKIYLPQVLVAAHAMYEGLDVLLPRIPKGDMKNSKTAITAVVQGDVHDIGKNIVKTMLTAGGFIVDDLGKDVPPAEIAKVSKEKGINVVCMSTLMTPTMDSMEAAMKQLRDNNYRKSCIVTIGGPPTSPKFAIEIGADHRDENAQNCVHWLKENM
jgi:methanogenic corrinoid protein MtbC1